jgi:hypothetical protein
MCVSAQPATAKQSGSNSFKLGLTTHLLNERSTLSAQAT